MNLLLKQLQRGKLLTFLLSLLLAAAIAFFSISVSAWQSIMSQMTGINQQYTTIAIPSVMDQYGGEDLYREQQRLSGLLEPDNYSTAALNAPHLLSVDRRCLLSACVAGQRALSSGALDPLQYAYEYDLYTYNLTVLAVKCVSVTDWPSAAGRGYSAEFEFVDAPSRLESYGLLPYADVNIVLGNSCYNKDGSIPFEEGKTYLIRGFYQDFPIRMEVDDQAEGTGWSFKKYRADPSRGVQGGSSHLFYSMGTYTSFFSWDVERQEMVQTGTPDFIIKRGDVPGTEDEVYFYFPEEGLPFFAEYTGGWGDFLETPEGRVWRDEIIPMCERNQHSAAVILTDSLQSVYAFNTGAASVLECRAFTPEEYASGAPVCLVSASYAILNGLQVGDTLNLDLYNSGYAIEHLSQSNGISSTEGNSVVRLPMIKENRIGVKKDYTIVGVYSAPEFAVGVHNFHADTIFVPKASVPNAERYEDPYSDYLNTYILENGTADEFEAYMTENGFGGSFLYFDQDFGEIVSAMESLRSNAQRLLGLGTAAFVLAAMLFVFLSLRRMAPTVRGMRLMGVKPGRVWRELTAAFAVLTAGSAALGGLLGAALYGFVTGKTLSGSVALRPGTLALCAAGAAAVLLAVSALCALPEARRKLMQSPKKGK